MARQSLSSPIRLHHHQLHFSAAKVILDKQANIARVGYAFGGGFALDGIQQILGHAHIQGGGLGLELEMCGFETR
jgi:hypothetical protein